MILEDRHREVARARFASRSNPLSSRFDIEKTSKMNDLDHRFSVAPMMDWNES